MKLKAHSLLYSLILLIIVSTLISALLYAMLWNKVSEERFVKEHQLEQHLLSAKIFIEQKDFLSNHLNKEYRQIINDDSLRIKLIPWGVYVLAKCTAFSGKVHISRNYLYGAKVNKDTTLVLIDHKNPLVLVGNAALQGKLQVPQSGIRYGNIARNYFNGLRISEQNLTYSSENFPKVLIPKAPKSGPELQMPQILENRMENIFSAETKYFTSSKAITLSSHILGNIAIHSKSEITVSRQAKMYNVILTSPKITVQAGFKGVLHLVADSVFIEDGVSLAFPSSICATNNVPIYVKIGDYCKYGGAICCYGDENEKMPIVEIGKQTRLVGEIVSNGFVQLNGKVTGRITTNSFLHRQSGATYINYLVDAEINKLELQEPTFPSGTYFTPQYLQYIETFK
jgi:cytoskeletal protein CcmA (bactofilin family)